MSIKGKSKRKQNLEARNRDAAKKITRIVIISTIVIVVLLYLLFSNA